MKIFLDTNIIIDLLDDKRIGHKNTTDFFEQATKKEIKLIISEDVLTTVYYVCKKSFSREKMFSSIEILNEEFKIANFGRKIIRKAIGLCQKNEKFDFEDVLQSICAGEENCDLIITNDKNFPEAGVEVKTMKKFLNV